MPSGDTGTHRLTLGLRLGPLKAALDPTGRDREGVGIQKWYVEGSRNSERRWACSAKTSSAYRLLTS